jgi:AICAR transformylase/IMP cyclohydrolase PurH
MNAETQAVKSQDTAPEVKEQETTTIKAEKQTQSFSQDDLERIVGERVARERAKYEKKYSGIDVDHYNKLIEKEEKTRQAELEKRGQFEALLKEQADKFNSKIQQYQSELTSIKVDGTLLSEASNLKAVNPTQVTQLLKGQLRLNEAGQVDVIDTKTGQVRYNDKGDPIQVKDLVSEFLSANPHFVSAGPTGSNTGKGTGSKESLAVNDINQLDMTIPEHRARYKEIMKARGIRI